MALLVPHVPPSHHTLPSHPVPQDPWLPFSSSWPGMGRWCWGRMWYRSPRCASVSLWPQGVALLCLSSTLALPPALWHPCRSQDTGPFAPGAQDKDTKGSLVGATINWAAPSLPLQGQGTPWGHIYSFWPWGAAGKPRRGGHGGIWEPRGPRAEEAQPSLPALFIASTAMCRTCAAARAGAGVSPGCACSGLCPGALTTSGALGNLVPAHTVGLSRHCDPATCPQALGLSGCQHRPACGQSWAEHELPGGPQLPVDHGSRILPCASLRE